MFLFFVVVVLLCFAFDLKNKLFNLLKATFLFLKLGRKLEFGIKFQNTAHIQYISMIMHGKSD